jgi:flavin reductase (DIM6/NTAB) family NADH-FMN oxidoreductase RutF
MNTRGCGGAVLEVAPLPQPASAQAAASVAAARTARALVAREALLAADARMRQSLRAAAPGVGDRAASLYDLLQANRRTPEQMSTNIDPQGDADRFRKVLGHLPTGVTVVTAHHASGPVAMSANSVTSVSLEPPLILLCPAKSSETWPSIRAAGSFCVNVMAHHHEELCRRFAAKNVDRFAGLEFAHLDSGPALEGATAWIECSIRDENDAGDHSIVVADVLAVEADSEANPLVFFRGRYGTFRERVSAA